MAEEEQKRLEEGLKDRGVGRELSNEDLESHGNLATCLIL